MSIILFTGDTFLQTKYGSMPFDQSIIGEFQKSDNVCINLETTVGTGGKIVQKAYNFQTTPAMLEYAKSVGVTVASVANNHSMDYSKKGFEQTLDNLHNCDLTVVGASSENYCRLKSADVKYCISSYCGNGGGISPLYIDDIICDIGKHMKDNDFQIVCLHWGEEYLPYPSPRQQKVAHQIIDAGASVVIGHHPHVMQGYEEYHNGVIFYSLGNFNFFVDHPWAKKLIETTKAYCVSLDFYKGQKLKYEVIPVTINENWQPSVITDPDEQKRFFKYFNKISGQLSNGVGSFFL